MDKEKMLDPRDRGRKGGTVRAQRLTAAQRSESARQAALARHRRRTKEELSEAMRRAVQARWRKAKSKQRARRAGSQ